MKRSGWGVSYGYEEQQTRQNEDVGGRWKGGRSGQLELTSVRNDEICLFHTLFHSIFELESLDFDPPK